MRLYGRQEFLNQANDKVTLNKKLITKEARYILEEKLSLDIEFYEYLLQRLFNQANKSGILPQWKNIYFPFFKIDSSKNLHFDTVLLKEHGNEWTEVWEWDEIFSELIFA